MAHYSIHLSDLNEIILVAILVFLKNKSRNDSSLEVQIVHNALVLIVLVLTHLSESAI